MVFHVGPDQPAIIFVRAEYEQFTLTFHPIKTTIPLTRLEHVQLIISIDHRKPGQLTILVDSFEAGHRMIYPDRPEPGRLTVFVDNL